MAVDMRWAKMDEDILAISGLVDAHLRYKNTQGPPRGYGYYHPSAFGKCLRLMQYMRYESMGLVESQKEEVESVMIRIWDKGHNMHRRWAKYFEEMGVLRGVWQCTNPLCFDMDDPNSTKEDKLRKLQSPFHYVDEDGKDQYISKVYGLDDKLGAFKPEKCTCGSTHFIYHEITVSAPELNLKGHSDLILDFSKLNLQKFKDAGILYDGSNLPTEPVVADMKTCNDYTFKQKVCHMGPSLEYQIQLSIYSNILGCKYGLLIYENKNDSTLRMFKIPAGTETMFEHVKKQAETMNKMVEFKMLPPPRVFEKDSYECTKCPFAKICHSSKIWSDPQLKEKRQAFYGNLLVSD